MTRVDRLLPHLDEAELTALLVVEPHDLRWLTGFTGTNGLAVVGRESRRFATDFRYVEQAAEQVTDGWDRVKGEQDLLGSIEDALPAGDVRLGFDDTQVTVRTHARLRELLDDRIELVPASGLLKREREIKEPAEVEAIREAAKVGDAAYAWIAAHGLAGHTERAVAQGLEAEMRRLGAEPSFPSIVASGAHGALPHAVPRDVEIERGTLVVLDLGAELDGYCSDSTRTWATGPLDGEAEEVYALVLAAQEEALAAVRPGITGTDADKVARDRIEGAGHGEHFGHGLGHGVGLEVHEGPRLSKTGTAELRAGNVVTVEPGVYLPGRFGVRIEDLVLVTDDGHDVITAVDKALRTI